MSSTKKRWNLTQEDKNRYYRLGRLKLIARLGGECVDCGEADPNELQFDHKHGRTWVARKKCRAARLALYRKEAEADEIELRCGTCNKKKGKPFGSAPLIEPNNEPLPE